MVKSWKPIVAAFVIFGAGLVTGRVTVNFPSPSPKSKPPEDRGRPPGQWMRRGPDSPLRDLSERMAENLDLTTEQRQQIEQIVRETQDRMRALVDEMKPGLHNEFNAMQQRIREVLTADQWERYEQLCPPREPWHHKRGDRPPTDPRAAR